MSTDLDRLDWHGEGGPSTPLEPLWRQPARLIVAIGALMVIVGCLVPWATGIDGNGTRVGFGANDGTADGVYLIVGALFILISTLSRGAADSRSRTLQLAPLFTTIVMAIIWVGGQRAVNIVIEHWIASGGSGSTSWGLWLTLAGIGIAAVGSLWIYVRRPSDIRENTVSLGEEWQLTRWGATEALAGIVGAIVGSIAGLLIAVTIAGRFGVLLMIILCAGGFIFGMQAAVQVVHYLERRRGVEPTTGP